jgi:hypothetical protein
MVDLNNVRTSGAQNEEQLKPPTRQTLGSARLTRRAKTLIRRWPPSRAQLEALINEATVDAHDEYEQRMGFATMIGDDLALPFETEVLGIPVTVEGMDFSAPEDIVAICRRGTKRQKIGILHLPLPKSVPAGAEWIEAYRRWTRHG